MKWRNLFTECHTTVAEVAQPKLTIFNMNRAHPFFPRRGWIEISTSTDEPVQPSIAPSGVLTPINSKHCVRVRRAVSNRYREIIANRLCAILSNS